jgi:type 1 fimbria pilin
MYPFTIRLVDCKSDDTQPLILKVDPGSRKTGVAIVREDEAKTSAHRRRPGRTQTPERGDLGFGSTATQARITSVPSCYPI